LDACFEEKTHYTYLFSQNYPPMPLGLLPSTKRLYYLCISKKII
jgi:hypothetical protein